MKRIKTFELSSLCLFITIFLLSCAPSTASKENGRIVFQSDRDGNFDLYIMNPDGTNQQNLTNDTSDSKALRNNLGPIASPDGKQLLYETDIDGNYEIYVFNIVSGARTNLTKNNANDDSPTWSPDGAKIAFVSDRDAVLVDKDRDIWTTDIYIMNADGSNIRRITTDNQNSSYGTLSWSPDGKKLAFCMLKQSPYGLIYLAGLHTFSLDTRELTRLTFDSSTIQCNPHWSPDGKQIVYSLSGSKLFNIYVMNADGTDQTALSPDPAIYDQNPSWSPDGKKIVFSSRRDGKYHLYVMNADGSNQVQLTNGPGEETSPTWLPATSQ